MPDRPTTPIDKTRELQRKLYLAAKGDKGRRFHALFDRIYRPDILWRAWEEVKANRGSPGVDDQAIEQIEQQGVEGFLQSIAEDLKAGRYRPQAVLRVYIPKPDGRQRPLGIPTVRDRVVQQACKIVIEPIFEANFLDNSYGFRPKRSAAQAVKAVKDALWRGRYVVDADILSYFDTISHDLLETILKKRISDRRVLKLVRQWLKAGIMEEGEWRLSEMGSPQGGVISPLLSNAYLHVFDMYWQQRYSHLGKLVRYCDDFVIICNRKRDAEEALQAVEQILKRLKLTLHPTKTRVVSIEDGEGFEFLGFHFQKVRSKRSGKPVPMNWPGHKAMKAIRSRIGQLTNRSWMNVTLTEVVENLNPVIVGWRSYFRVGNSTRKFQQLDSYVRMRLLKASRIRNGPKGRRFNIWTEDSGLEHFYKPGICRKEA